MAVIKEIWTYPLKSGQGVEHEDISITENGLKNDRNWMLVTLEDGIYRQFTQRDESPTTRMSTIQTVLQWGDDRADAEEAALFILPHDSLEVSNPNLFGIPSTTVRLHSSIVRAVDAGDRAANWFSEYLDHKVRLVRFPGGYQRMLKPQHHRIDDHTAFADGGQNLIANEATLEALAPHFNNTSVSMKSFRPNLVFGGMEPFEEDIMTGATIISVATGEEIEMRITHPCTRCNMTMFRQDEGDRYPKGEPLRTLSQLRTGTFDGKKERFFGVNAVFDSYASGARISRGDRVVIHHGDIHPSLAECKLHYIA